MLVSLNWLKDYIDIEDKTPEEIAEILTNLGLEVEGIEKTAPFSKDIIVAKVLDAQPHPNADTLQVCKVDSGEAEPLTIVCGAPNARKNLTVALIRVGSELPDGLKVKKTKLRGEPSFGMMCSEKELGISEDHEGIIELDDKRQIGESVVDVLGLQDTVFELSITPNRSDCLSYIGIARDLAAKLERPLKVPKLDVERSKEVSSKDNVKIKITDKEGCGRFVALYIEGVAATSSPNWLKQRLEASGVRSRNLIVDATNYAMLEYGQPIHPYDERDVSDHLIEVRKAKPEETITSLDGQKRQLETSDLLICDKKGPIGVAGVMGGENSEVKEDTKNIIVEVAFFAPSLIRRTSKRLGLHTEASHRFERIVNIDILPEVAVRVGDLLVKCTEELNSKEGSKKLEVPRIAADLVDIYPDPVMPAKVALRLERAKQILALRDLTVDKVQKHLESLQIKMIDKADERMVFEIPLWRSDIEREIDLIEEIGRLEGFDKIPYQLPNMNILPTPEDSFIDFCEDARIIVSQTGFRETISFPFVSAAEMENLGITKEHPLFPTIQLQNPLSEEFSLMQTTLAPNLFKAVKANRHHGEKGSRLFEFGRGYFNFKQSPINEAAYPSFKGHGRDGRHLTRRAKANENRPTERHLLSAIIDQPLSAKGWSHQEEAATFFHAKQVIVGWLEAFGVTEFKLNRGGESELPFLHPGISAFLTIGDKTLGYFGELHPETAAKLGFDADSTPLLIELDIEEIFDSIGKDRKFDTRMYKFPPVTRDFAFLVDKKVTHNDFETAFNSFDKRRTLKNFRLFDVYEDSSLPEGKKSMAYTFYFQSTDKTLTDKEVEGEIKPLIQWLGNSLAATLR